MRNGAGEARLNFIKPQEPILVLKPPVGGDWLHEIKFDGFRTQIILEGQAFVPSPRTALTGPSVIGRSSPLLRSCRRSRSFSTAR